MDYQQYIEHFKQTPAWAGLVATVEASPWHREENVAVHTEMALDWYATNLAPLRTPQQNKITSIALLFHDTGKPAAEEVLEKKDGSGTYRRYAGHEQDSAVTFTETWLTDPFLQQLLTPDEARQVRWIIEHHLPFGYKDKVKVSALRTAVAHTLREDEECFYDHLQSDAFGRISDGMEEKLKAVADWIAQFKAVPLETHVVDPRKGICYILVGPSGSGKSTWRAQYEKRSSVVLSLDEMRLEYFNKMTTPFGAGTDVKQDYRDAVAYTFANDSAFRAFANARIADRFEELRVFPCNSADVIVDNTNGSKKVRAQYVQQARALHMKIVAVEFWTTFKTLLARQKTRGDKEVPYTALKQQYFAQTSAWKGSEVDAVIQVYHRET
jgi:predicted kinase